MLTPPMTTGAWVQEEGEGACRAAPVKLRDEVAGDFVAWALLLLGVVFGLGTLGSVELLTHLGGR